MIARPQADILNMLPVTQVTPLGAKSVETGTTLRFDAALLEAAKAMRDGESGKPELVLVPKVRQALEAALARLDRKPLDQLQLLAQQPQTERAQFASIVFDVAQTFGLNEQEAGVLNDMLPVALPQVLAYKTQEPVPGMSVASLRSDGAKPGPQGGIPVKTASPEDLLTLDLESQPHPDVGTLPEDAFKARHGLHEALAQGLTIPVLVSTRTDDGSSTEGTITLSRVNASKNREGTSTQPQATAPGRVIQVLGQTQNEDGALNVAPAPATQSVPRPGNTSLLQPTSASVEGTRTPSVLSPFLPEASGASGVAPATGKESGALRPTASAPVQGDRPLAALPKGAVDLNVEFLSTNSIRAPQAQPGTEVTLKEDGSWVLPKAEGQKASSAPAPSGAARHSVPQPGSDAALQSLPSVVDGPASLPQGAAQAPAIRTASAPSPLPFQSLSLERLGQAPQTPAATQPLAAQPAGAQAPVAPPQTVASSPVPAAPQAPVAQGPAASPAPVQAFVAAPAAPTSPVTENRWTPPQGETVLAEAGFGRSTSADSVPTRRTTGEDAFSGLAQFGQDALKALAQQTVRAYALRESVFRQVSEALREAAPDQNGRLRIQLKPAELGEVNVELMLKDGKLSARLLASHGEVRDAFVRDLPAFKAGLESQGVLVRDISVAVRAGVADQDQQPPRQTLPQPWSPEGPGNKMNAPVLSVPASVGYAYATDVKQQRFSALA